MAGTVIDNFINGGAYATDHIPPLGGQLAAAVGTDPHGALITTANRLRGNAAGDQVFYYPAASLKAAKIEAVLSVLSNANTTGIMLRVDPAANNYYLLKYFGALGRFAFGAYAGGNPMGSIAQVNNLLTPGQRYKLHYDLDAFGVYAISLDGIVIFAGTDVNITAAGYAGIYTNGANADNAGIQVDSFTVFDAAATPIPTSPTFTTAFGTTFDGKGAPAVSTIVTFRLVDPQVAYDLYGRAPFTVTSDGTTGYLSVALLANAVYEMRAAGAGANAWVRFTTGTDTTYHLPKMVAKLA